MQKVTFREVLRSNGIRTMAAGFVVMMFGIFLVSVGLESLGHWLGLLGILTGLIGFTIHTRLFISAMTDKHKK